MPNPDALAIQPTDLDPEGRGSNAGLPRESVSGSATYNSNTKTWETNSTGDDRAAIKGKLTLKFTVDASGTIQGWSVSPKKAAKAR